MDFADGLDTYYQNRNVLKNVQLSWGIVEQSNVVSLGKKKFEIISIEQTSKSISLNNFSSNSKKIALIFGNEVKGIAQKIIDLSDKSVEINQYGVKKSMNVAVTTGIVLWSIINKK